MDPKPKSTPLLPAIFVVIIVVLVGGLLYLGDTGPSAGPKPTVPTFIPTGDIDSTDDGMVDDLPNPNAEEYKDIGDGLKIWDVKIGTGPECLPGQTVMIHYTGWRLDGGKFDTSRKGTKEPVTFPLTRLIAGWQKGIPNMRAGGIRRLYIPGFLAYGAQGDSRVGIGPNATLVFEVKLIQSH